MNNEHVNKFIPICDFRIFKLSCVENICSLHVSSSGSNKSKSDLVTKEFNGSKHINKEGADWKLMFFLQIFSIESGSFDVHWLVGC